MTPPLIEARDVSRVFSVRGGLFGPRRELRAVDDVSVQIGDGETVALVGESGSGKTTLGRILLGLLPPTSGRVLYGGRPLEDLTAVGRRQYRREVQVVFQNTSSSLNPRKTIGASIEVPLRHNLGLEGRAAGERAARLLERVGLEPETFLSRYPHELSGGQRQRVGIARAIASEPRFVVADEPVSALDVSIRAQILQLLRDLQRETGLAYLFITHDLGVVTAVASRVLVMYLGAVVERGPVDRLFRAPGHPYTRALLAATPVPDPTRARAARGLRGEIPSPVNPPPGCRFHPRCPFVQDVCRTTVPPMVEFEDGVASACHFAADVRRESPPCQTPSRTTS